MLAAKTQQKLFYQIGNHEKLHLYEYIKTFFTHQNYFLLKLILTLQKIGNYNLIHLINQLNKSVKTLKN